MSMHRYSSGFTLVELVAVIVLLGVIGVGMINFIRDSADAYREVTRRDEVAQVGRFAIERVSREMRAALPGSVRTSGNCIEFVPVIAASFYTDLPVAGFGPSANTLTSIEFASDASQANYASVFAVVPADVYSLSHLRQIDISSSSTVGQETTIDFVSQPNSFPEHSPGRRIYFVDGPVSFCVVNTQLFRYQGYGYSVGQPSPPASGSALLAEFIQLDDNGSSVTPFRFSPDTLQRNGVVHLDFRFLARGSTDEWVRFSHDIAMRGAP